MKNGLKFHSGKTSELFESAIREAIGSAATDSLSLIDLQATLLEEFENLLDDIRTAPEIPEKQRPLYRERLGRLRECFVPTPGEGTFGVRPASDSELLTLESCAHQLSDELFDKEWDPLREVRESADKLRETIQSTQPNSSLRKILLELVRLTDNAIAYYEIHGAKGLKSAFQKMLAEVFEIYSRQQARPTPPEERSIWAIITSHLSTVDAAAGKLLKYPPLLASARQLFLTDDSSS